MNIDSFDNILPTYNAQSLVVVHQNMKSVREHFNLFLTALNCRSPKPHIIILTDIWVHSLEVPLYNINAEMIMVLQEYLHIYTMELFLKNTIILD